LKSVYLKARGGFMKLLIHKCYINPLNLFNQVRGGGVGCSISSTHIPTARRQVGLIAINVLGQPVAGDKSSAAPSHVASAHGGGARPMAALPPVVAPGG
jgi:hypothetical protein